MNEPVQPPRRSGSPAVALLGGVLIVLGLAFFIGQQFNLDVGDATWPFYVIAPGVALLAFGLTQQRGSGLAIAGSIVTMVGLVLFYQNLTDHWESWAYAWALVGPGGSAIGMLLYGTRSGDPKMARDGFWGLLGALALFGAGLVFFEGILGISGEPWPLPEWALPVSVMVIGVLVLLRAMTYRHDRGPTVVSSGPEAAEAPASKQQAADQPAPEAPRSAGKP